MTNKIKNSFNNNKNSPINSPITNIIFNSDKPNIAILLKVSLLSDIILALIYSNKINLDEAKNLTEDEKANIVSPEKQMKIKDKIKYNNIKRYKYEINQFVIYEKLCYEAMTFKDDLTGDSYRRTMNAIINIYNDSLRKYIKIESESTKLDIIRKHSDDILDCVVNNVKEKFLRYKSFEALSIDETDITINCKCFVIYCFIECKILEKCIDDNKQG